MKTKKTTYFVCANFGKTNVTLGSPSGYNSRTIPVMLATELSQGYAFDDNQVVIEHWENGEVIYAELFENGKSRMR